MSKQKNLIDYGQAAEQKAAAELILRGFYINWGVSDKQAYDFIADLDGKLFKIQVKGTFGKNPQGKYQFSLRNNRGAYTAKEVDFYILYVHDTEDFYVIPFAFATSQTIRISERFAQFRNAWHLIK